MQWFLSRGRLPFLFLVGSVTLFLGYHCFHLEIDQDNRSMDADDTEQKALEVEFRETFVESDTILVAVHGEHLLELSGREKITKIAGELRDIRGISGVFSLVDSDFAVPDAMLGVLLSEDRDTATIRVSLEDFGDDGGRLGEVIEQIKAIAHAGSRDGIRIAVTGLPLQKYEAGVLVRKDQEIFSPLSLLVLGLVLLIVTGRISGMLFPLIVSVLTICWTLGIYSLLGHSLNMITSLLPPVIMTLSVATTIHIYLHWLHDSAADSRKRIVNAVRHLSRPCLFTSLTTVIGFLSLLLSETPAVRLFGMFAALGVGISYVLGVVGIAVGLSYLPVRTVNRPPFPRHTAGAYRLLDAIGRITVNHPRKLILLSLLVGAIGVIGAMKIETDTDLLHYMGDDNSLVIDTEFIAQEVVGTSAFELFLKTNRSEAIISTEQLLEFSAALRRIRNVRKVLGLTDLLPAEAFEMEEKGVPLSDILGSVDLPHYLSEDRTETRITVFTESIGSKAGSEMIQLIRQESERFLVGDFELNFVGGFYRVVEDSERLVSSQLKSFLVAIILILISIGVVFRSVVYTLLAIIPNVVPLLLTASVMGFFGIALSTGTAMIASVVIGIAVDDTIHYLSAFRRSGCADRGEAIRKTTRATGFVLLSTTMALSAGFWVAIFGSFQPTAYFALLSGLTMWFALACDILVLPAFLKVAAPTPKLQKIDS